MLNKHLLIGRVGKDPEVQTFANSKKATFSLATSEKYKTKAGELVEETQWHNVECWSPLAEVVESYVKKGSKIYVEGMVIYSTYEKDGEKKYKTYIKGQVIRLLDSKGEHTESSESSESPEPVKTAPKRDFKINQNPEQKMSLPEVESDSSDDDLPF